MILAIQSLAKLRRARGEDKRGEECEGGRRVNRKAKARREAGEGGVGWSQEGEVVERKDFIHRS